MPVDVSARFELDLPEGDELCADYPSVLFILGCDPLELGDVFWGQARVVDGRSLWFDGFVIHWDTSETSAGEKEYHLETRKAFEDDDEHDDEDLVETIRNVGYRFNN